MTTFSDGDSAASVFSTSSGDMLFYLQNILDNKEKQLQNAGTLSELVLAQRMELEERIRQLRDADLDRDPDAADDVDNRQKWRELAETIKTWDAENDELTSVFAPSFVLTGAPSPPTHPVELSRGDIERSLERSKSPGPGTSAAQSSRRAKNAAHRTEDVQFAFEIGSGLLSEVRRLQALLAERDKKFNDEVEAKEELYDTVDDLKIALRQQEQSADKYKEENWNLEVTLQELRAQLAESQANNSRLEGELKKLTKLLTNSRETADHHKNEAEKHQNAYEELKAKHETDVAQARKVAASLQRDKSDLQHSLDSLKVEMAKQTKRFPRFGSPLTPNGVSISEAITPAEGEDEDVFSTAAASTNRKNRGDTSGILPLEGFDDFPDSSPESSPSKGKLFLAPNHPTNEIEALQQRLAHAQRQISTLKGTVQREKEMRIELKRRLEASPASTSSAYLPPQSTEDDEEEEYMDEEEEAGKSKARLTPFRQTRGRGRGRGRAVRGGRGSFARKLELAAQDASSDDEYIRDPSSPPPPLPIAPIPHEFNFQEDDPENVLANMSIPEEEEGEETDTQSQNQIQNSPSAPSIVSNRTSVDGMDPAFANVLKRSASGSSFASFVSNPNHSPLRQVLSRSTRGGTIGRRQRGGAAFQEARPPSIVVQPGVLADEFGLGMGMERSPEREFKEFGCQTEVIEDESSAVEPTVIITSPSILPLQSLPPPPELVEIGIQAEPVVEPEPERVVERAEVSLQTETETEEKVISVVLRSDASVQHEDLTSPTPASVLVSTGTATEPESTPKVEPIAVSAPAPIYSQAEVQTHAASSTDADVQTLPEPKPISLQTTDVQTQTVPEFAPTTTHAEIQTTASPRPQDGHISFLDASVSDTSGDTTITPRPPPLSMPDFGEVSDDEDAQTETGVPTETDMDDYQDARQSLVTPTTETDDFHSIMTVTDNEFSSSEDGESIKASRLNSREVSAMSSAVSMPLAPRAVAEASVQVSSPIPESEPEPVPVPKPTYDSKAVETDVIEEPPIVAPPVVEESKTEPEPPLPEPPKPELKEMSIQTDEWSPPPLAAPVPVSVPPAPVLITAPSTPAQSPSPSLRPSQQFQFISPPPSAGPTSTFTPNVPAAPSPSRFSPSKDSSVSIPRPRTSTSTSDRRRSIETTLSELEERLEARSRTPSSLIAAIATNVAANMAAANSGATTIIDKSRPPMMVLPPPPKQPPPPNSMPPPNFIPERRIPTSSNASRDIPPPRPSSPPPPELIQRAMTPSQRPFGLRSHTSSIPSSHHQPLRQPSSTSSFRSGPIHHPQPSPSIPSFSLRDRERERVSLNSGSQRSSMSSDNHLYEQMNQRGNGPQADATPDRTLGATTRQTQGSTDPVIIHAITQTMIGEFLYKYTRRAIGKGHGERRHKRFFWVHPYTRTLYWSSADPGFSSVTESSAKSAYIDGVRSVLDPNPMPPGIYQYSVVVSTPQREMKFTAPTKERHDIWVNALQYLLSRPSAAPVQSPSNGITRPNSPLMSVEEKAADDEQNDRATTHWASPQSQRSTRTTRTALTTDSFNITPRGQRSQSQLSLRGSMGKRSGTPAAEYLRWSQFENAPVSPSKSFEYIPANDGELDFELHDDTLSDGGFEGLENVRACCDGRHTVGRSGKIHHHHHHHDHNHNHAQERREPSRTRDQHLDPNPNPNPNEISRPVSPAWSFRSRAGSASSRDREGGFFSRFGSRRSNKTALSSSSAAQQS